MSPMARDEGESADAKRDYNPMPKTGEAEPRQPPRRPARRLDAPRLRLSGLHAGNSTRSSRPKTLCDAEELDAAARLPRQAACSILHGRGRGSPTGCSGACWRSRTAPGSSISRKACWIRRGSPASSSIRCSPCPSSRRSDTDFRDTVVTLLLDNSGSMRGRPDHGRRDCCADILARTLERCGVKVEILGFTTRAWKGGQSRETLARRRASRPIPGASTICATSSTSPPMRPGGGRASNLGLMMREGLLKENIDGEALTGRTRACWRGPSSGAS